MTENGSYLYIDEWKKLFGDPDYLPNIRQKSFAGGLRNCRFRSICWKISLDCLPLNLNEWEKESVKRRSEYDELKPKVLIDPNSVTANGHFDPNIENPLSQNTESIWRQFHEDEELKLIITQDVIRTFPEIQYFHLPEVRQLMINILFVYARKNPSISYRQGMHELLAPIIFVLHSDHQSFLHAAEINCLNLVEQPDKNILPCVLDHKYIEHDSYIMFSQLMEYMELWYTVRDKTPKKLDSLHSSLLLRFDNELYHHLTKLEITPQIYGIRWLRLLFGREFPIQDLLVIWDAVIVDNRDFQLIEYLFISMLISIRNKLLCDDYATCLSYLMRFPPASDVHFIIDMALHLREPYKYERPATSSHQLANHSALVGGNRPEIYRAQQMQRRGSGRKLPDKDANDNRGMLSSFSSMMSTLTRTFDGISTTNTNSESLRATNELLLPKQNINLSSQASVEVGIDASQIINKEMKSIQSSSGEPNQSSEEEIGQKRPRPTSISNKFKLVDQLKEEIEEMENMRKYCAHNMTIHIDHIQECISKQSIENSDEIMVSLAFLKRIRDILKKTLSFKQATEDNFENDVIPH
ncbi:TBC1 domain, member 5 [Chamberlinius hualienensis]